MKSYIAERATNVANYFIENKTTIRKVSKEFGIAKTTAHYDLTKILPQINLTLSKKVRQLLDINKDERAIRGGMATRIKNELKQPKFNFNQIVFYIQRLNKKTWVDSTPSRIIEISINKYNKFEYILYKNNSMSTKIKEKDIFKTFDEAENKAFKIT